MSVFAWRLQFRRGAYSYFENAISGDRKAKSVGGYSGVDTEWLGAAPSGRAWFVNPLGYRFDLTQVEPAEGVAVEPPAVMWAPGEDPSIDDDLMNDWLMAVVEGQGRGLTGARLGTTMRLLVSHLSGGADMVVRSPRNSEVEGGAPNV